MQKTLSISQHPPFSELVIEFLCEWCLSVLPAGSRSGWSGQFCVTAVPAGVSSQHSKPSQIHPQNVPRVRKKDIILLFLVIIFCLYLCIASVYIFHQTIVSLQPAGNTNITSPEQQQSSHSNSLEHSLQQWCSSRDNLSGRKNPHLSCFLGGLCWTVQDICTDTGSSLVPLSRSVQEWAIGLKLTRCRPPPCAVETTRHRRWKEERGKYVLSRLETQYGMKMGRC